MKKVSVFLLMFCTFFTIQCSRKDTFSNKNIIPKQKSEAPLWTFTYHPEQQTALDIIKTQTANLSVVTESCNVGWSLSGYSVFYNCNTGTYFLTYKVWIIGYNKLNNNTPTGVRARINTSSNWSNGVLVSTYGITPPVDPNYVGFEYNFNIDLGVSTCPSGTITVIFEAVATNCNTTQNMSTSDAFVNLSQPNPCSPNVSYSPGAFLAGNRTIRFERLILCFPNCIINPNNMVYEYRIKGSNSTWNTITSPLLPPTFPVTTAPLNPGTYEYRCKGICTGGGSSGYSIVQPGVNEFTIQ